MKRVVVAGAGIVGLASAREIRNRYNAEVTVIEQEPSPCLHQTGRNSGVIHSGIYYGPGTEKSKGCKEGIDLLRAFCDEHGIARKKVGKLICATDDDELPELERLYNNGLAHAIPGLALVDTKRISEIEPAVVAKKAIHLPNVEIIDYTKVGEALKSDLESRGGALKFDERIVALKNGKDALRVVTKKSEYDCDLLVNCGGLQCDRICAMMESYVPVRIIPFRGEYYDLSPEYAAKVKGLVYPVPDPLFPFLGVHLTPMLDGRVTAGPNAVLALSREGYSWRDINPRDLVGTFAYPGFWRMSFRHIGVGFYEMARSLSKPLFVKSIRKFMPGIPSSALTPGTSGVRAQAVDSSGRLISDFVFKQSSRAVHILNAPSPAATASLAIGAKIAKICEESLGEAKTSVR